MISFKHSHVGTFKYTDTHTHKHTQAHCVLKTCETLHMKGARHQRESNWPWLGGLVQSTSNRIISN